MYFNKMLENVKANIKPQKKKKSLEDWVEISGRMLA